MYFPKVKTITSPFKFFQFNSLLTLILLCSGFMHHRVTKLCKVLKQKTNIFTNNIYQLENVLSIFEFHDFYTPVRYN